MNQQTYFGHWLRAIILINCYNKSIVFNEGTLCCTYDYMLHKNFEKRKKDL